MKSLNKIVMKLNRLNEVFEISTIQLLAFGVMTAITGACFTVLINTFIAYTWQPEVFVNSKNECVKVINFDNGDSYTCNDVGKTLRRYRKIK
jgi:hypothetical protein